MHYHSSVLNILFLCVIHKTQLTCPLSWSGCCGMAISWNVFKSQIRTPSVPPLASSLLLDEIAMLITGPEWPRSSAIRWGRMRMKSMMVESILGQLPTIDSSKYIIQAFCSCHGVAMEKLDINHNYGLRHSAFISCYRGQQHCTDSKYCNFDYAIRVIWGHSFLFLLPVLMQRSDGSEPCSSFCRRPLSAPFLSLFLMIQRSWWLRTLPVCRLYWYSGQVELISWYGEFSTSFEPSQ